MAKFERPQRGQRRHIDPDTWSAIVDAARAHYQQQSPSQPSAPASGRGGPASKSDLVLVKNDTELDLDRWAVLGIDGPIITPEENEREFQRRIALRGVLPEPQVHDDRYVVLHEPLRAGAIGRAHVTGVFTTRIWATERSHAYVIPGMVDVEGGGEEEGANEIPVLLGATSGIAQVLWVQGQDQDDDEGGEGGGGGAGPDLELPGWRWATIRIGGGAGSNKIWARITTSPLNPLDPHSWEQVVPTAHGFMTGEHLLSGVDNALNLQRGHPVPAGTIVELEPAGTLEDGLGEQTQMWVFRHYEKRIDQGIAPHDHRDNTPGSGGFAFSVFHPGTSLPMMPWGL